ncbi:MAG TPA: SRPBCC family protein [Chitinophagaceae bacterium]|nr:SRPBCC family protein [Chitinophagaceae bacterium]
MKLIKLALLSALLLFGLMTVLSLFIPSSIRISKAVNLASRPEAALSYARDTAHWERWHPAYLPREGQPVRPVQVRMLRNEPLQVVMAWETGRQVETGWQVHTYSGQDSVTLQWYLDFRLSWRPWEKFGSLLYEASYGAMLQEGLNNIKRLEEGASPARP